MISGYSAAEQGIQLLVRPSVGIRDPMACFVKCGISHNPCRISTCLGTPWETKSVYGFNSDKKKYMNIMHLEGTLTQSAKMTGSHRSMYLTLILL